MLQREQFIDLVGKAYHNLYDLVALRTQPLVYYLTDDRLTAKERSWQLHHILIEAIDELDPGPNAPAFSREWRRHRLMHLRFVEAQDVAVVIENLAISRRQFYREQKAAIETAADILRGRIITQPDEAAILADLNAEQEIPAQPAGDASRPGEAMELLREETRRFSQSQTEANIAEILQNTVDLLSSVLQDNHLTIDSTQVQPQQVLIAPILLRQILMGMLSYLISNSTHAALHIATATHAGVIQTQMRVDPLERLAIPSRLDMKHKMDMYDEMARLNGGSVRPLVKEDRVNGLVVELPQTQPQTILVIDDNEDMLSFFTRILSSNHYQVLTASSGMVALQIIEQQQPDYIILDLMIPDQDGWDLLSILRNHAVTKQVPIIICSVLKQRDLALSLGASGYLEKPITEDVLLAALQNL